MSAHRLMVARRHITWHVLPLGVAGFASLYLLSEFFSIWVDADVASVSFPYLVLLVFVSACAAMVAFAALPDEVPPGGLDLWASYIERRSYLYLVFAVGLIGDIGRSVAHYSAAHVVP